jgi:GNAT superfamily N-acetyltransferase
VTDERLDELAESARNRGLKLVRSRVRTPGKRRFGKVGLKDASGKPIFGMDAKGPFAKPEEVEDYLRSLGAKDWGASLDVAVLPRKKKTTTRVEPANDILPSASRGEGPAKLVEGPLRRASSATSPANAAEEMSPPPPPPARRPKPKPEPKLKIREAKPADAPRLVELIRELEHDVDENSVRKNLGKLRKLGELPLVATLDKSVVGLVGRHRMFTVHRPKPVGRIPILVVTEKARGRDIGRMLVDAVEQWCREEGCGMIEVTSNDRRASAHAFYRHMGYERTSIRFFKKL